MCAGHDTLTANRKEVNLKPTAIGRKGNAKNGKGISRNGVSEGSLRQNPCT
jgi:hypothetical protein